MPEFGLIKPIHATLAAFAAFTPKVESSMITVSSGAAPSFSSASRKVSGDGFGFATDDADTSFSKYFFMPSYLTTVSISFGEEEEAMASCTPSLYSLFIRASTPSTGI